MQLFPDIAGEMNRVAGSDHLEGASHRRERRPRIQSAVAVVADVALHEPVPLAVNAIQAPDGNGTPQLDRPSGYGVIGIYAPLDLAAPCQCQAPAENLKNVEKFAPFVKKSS